MIITPIQLRWSDFDILRHVYNGQYQQFYDLGKSEYFELVLELSLNWITTSEGLITASTSSNYYSPVEMDDVIEVRTKVEKVGNKSFTIFQEICDPQTGLLKSDSRTVMVCYNPIAKSTFEVPQKWRNAISREENKK